MTLATSADANQRRETFFRIIFGDATGFICIGRRRPNVKEMNEEFFAWPSEAKEMFNYIEAHVLANELYFCPQLLDDRQRRKENVQTTPTVWADLDACPPGEMLVEPSVVVESSPRRYQAYWLVPDLDPADAEDISRRIAYYHHDHGADKSGWDLTQLLRIPNTYNHKYDTTGVTPLVKILTTCSDDYTKESFDDYPQVQGFEYGEIPLPEDLSAFSPEEILERYRIHLPDLFWKLYTTEPQSDWSRPLWQTELFLAEAGMSREEMFVVAIEAAANKYRRDNKPNALLWKEVCKAFSHVEARNKYKLIGEYKTELEDLLTDEQREWCRSNPTIIERYIEWAKTVGDAAWQYHQAGAFIVLSSLLAGRVRLPTSFGVVAPNLWFMILADTTLTRKTTAMDLAVDILVQLDSEVVLATDGSVEGLLTGLSFRPGRPSLFLRDEFSGLLEAITKKDYYAGMAETFTKMYDGKYQKRILRKETIEVRDPCLIFFAGGIKTRILELLTAEQIASGFFPRFCVICAESDINNIRPLGPPTGSTSTGREAIVEEFRTIFHHFVADQLMNVNGNVVSAPKRWEAELTTEAWHQYNVYETMMLDAGLKSNHPDLATPTFDRLSKSGLKMAVLIAAARMEDRVVVQKDDIVRAFFYIEQWRPHTVEVLTNAGTTASERHMQNILRWLRKKESATRSQMMQNYRLTAHQADTILITLEQRGLIQRSKDGRTEKIVAHKG